MPVVCRGLIVVNPYEARAARIHLPSSLQLLDTIPLLEVMARTKKLDILGDDGGPTPRERDDVVKVKMVPRTAFDATAPVPLPYLLLD